MERPRLRRLASGWLLLLLCLLIQNLDPCSSVDEGRVLCKFRTVELGSNAASSSGVGGEDVVDPCGSPDVECEKVEVKALNHGTVTIRKLLQNQGRTSKDEDQQSPNPSSAQSPNSPRAQAPRKASSHLTNPKPPAPKAAPSPRRSPTLSDNGKKNCSSGKSHSKKGCKTSFSPSPSPSLSLSRSPSLSPSPVPGQSPASNASNPNSSAKTSQSKKHTILFLGVGVGSFGLLAFLTIFIHYYHGKKVITVNPWTTGLSGQLQKAFVTGVPQLKRSELETACEDFSNIIGSLSDCILYKGTLSSGVEIAVASTLVDTAKKWPKHSEAQFRKKIATLSKVNHKNFVNLLGYCEEEEPFTRMLVFEYAPNGTLFEHLHVKESEDLDWPARLRIGMGMAYCLDHMHQLDCPVVLRNLRSSNVYLTDDLAAKIADIDFLSETTAVPASASGNAGLLETPIPTQEIVVYDFGILLLEIISGRAPYSEEKGSLLDWASDYLRGSSHLREIVDPSLKGFYDKDIQAIGDIIRHCCDPEPQVRPRMREVATQLRDITTVAPDGAVPRSSALWWAELEILSTEAN